MLSAAFLVLSSASAAPLSADRVTVLSGAETLGWFLSGAGDVNGDGYDDVLISVEEDVFLHLGGADGLSDAAVSLGCDHCDVSSAGDVDGDGYDDVLLSALNDGSVVLRFGSASGLESGGVSLRPTSTAGTFGVAISSAGDVNGDGFDDVVVLHGHLSDGSIGGMHVFHGAADRDIGEDFTYTDPDALYGIAPELRVSEAGDVDGDGYDDIIVVTPRDEYGTSSGESGQAVVFSGSAAGITSDSLQRIGGDYASDLDRHPSGVPAAAGDLDGDGYDEVMVGVPSYNESLGGLWLHAGSAAGVGGAEVLLSGDGEISYGLGCDSGDFDGDGDVDLVTLSGEEAAVSRLHILTNDGAGALSEARLSLLLDGLPAAHWATLSSAGDINGDGADDLLVGLPWSETLTGHVIVFYGESPSEGGTGEDSVGEDGAGEDGGCSRAMLLPLLLMPIFGRRSREEQGEDTGRQSGADEKIADGHRSLERAEATPTQG